MQNPNLEHRPIFGNAVGSTLATSLYARAQGAAQYGVPDWHDAQAEQAWDALAALAQNQGQQLTDLVLKDRMNVVGTIRRSEDMDARVREFFSAQQSGQVVTLGIGLCNRAARMADLPVTWIGVDNPDVVALRQQIMPNDPTKLIAGSATEPHWLSQVDSTIPTVIVAEGLFMYLDRALVTQLLTRIGDYFTGRLHLVADMHHSLVTTAQNPITKLTGAVFNFGAKSPRWFSQLAPGWKLVAADDTMARITNASARVSKIFNTVSRGLLYGVITIEPSR